MGQDVKKIKARYWTSILYLDSAPSDWQERIENLKMSYLVSPLHDKDLNATGEPKKAHYHVVLIWDSPTTYNNALEAFKEVGAIEHFQNVKSIKAMARYLCHLDNPDKYQYEISEVLRGGVDYNAMIESVADKYEEQKMVIEYIERNEIFYFSVLMRIAVKYDDSLFRALSNNSYVIREYLKSRQYTLINQIDENKLIAEKVKQIYNVEV